MEDKRHSMIRWYIEENVWIWILYLGIVHGLLAVISFIAGQHIGLHPLQFYHMIAMLICGIVLLGYLIFILIVNWYWNIHNKYQRYLRKGMENSECPVCHSPKSVVKTGEEEWKCNNPKCNFDYP